MASVVAFDASTTLDISLVRLFAVATEDGGMNGVTLETSNDPVSGLYADVGAADLAGAAGLSEFTASLTCFSSVVILR